MTAFLRRHWATRLYALSLGLAFGLRFWRLYDLRPGVYSPAQNRGLTILAASVPTENNRAILAPITIH